MWICHCLLLLLDVSHIVSLSPTFSTSYCPKYLKKDHLSSLFFSLSTSNCYLSSSSGWWCQVKSRLNNLSSLIVPSLESSLNYHVSHISVFFRLLLVIYSFIHLCFSYQIILIKDTRTKPHTATQKHTHRLVHMLESRANFPDSEMDTRRGQDDHTSLFIHPLMSMFIYSWRREQKQSITILTLFPTLCFQSHFVAKKWL